MTQVVVIQPAPFVDNVVNGHEFYKKPYPLSVDADGYVQFQDFWQGLYFKAIGFQRDLDVQKIDVWWGDAFSSPESIIGLYLVTSDDDGNWEVIPHGIESFYTGEIYA